MATGCGPGPDLGVPSSPRRTRAWLVGAREYSALSRSSPVSRSPLLAWSGWWTADSTGRLRKAISTRRTSLMVFALFGVVACYFLITDEPCWWRRTAGSGRRRWPCRYGGAFVCASLPVLFISAPPTAGGSTSLAPMPWIRVLHQRRVVGGQGIVPALRSWLRRRQLKRRDQEGADRELLFAAASI